MQKFPQEGKYRINYGFLFSSREQEQQVDQEDLKEEKLKLLDDKKEVIEENK
jgi:hypothetical protein